MFGLSNRAARRARISSITASLCVLVLGLVACGGDGAATDATSTGPTILGESVTSLAATATTEAGVATTEATEGGEGSLVGKWHSDQTGETMEFTADGRLIVTSSGGAVTEMAYTADASNVSYLIEGVVVYTGTYSVDGDVLSQVDPDIEGTVLFDRVG